jgi:hypothetical protein
MHFVLATYVRKGIILEKDCIGIEKHITGIVGENQSKLYASYPNQERSIFNFIEHQVGLK